MEVLKRDNVTVVEFKQAKISDAILKAMKSSGIVNKTVARDIAEEIELEARKDGNRVTISYIEKLVFDKLVAKGQTATARAYEAYRSIREYQRTVYDIDGQIEGIIEGTNENERRENSNKNADTASTQRDLVAGQYSRDWTRRKLLPLNILEAHDAGIIHFHDSDYEIHHIINCCLVNLKDMFANNTVINKTLIETPHSFRTACTIATQIIQQIANGQYGGQTISVSHLAPFLRKSYETYYNEALKEVEHLVSLDVRDTPTGIEKEAESIALDRLQKELEDGVQTIQYQINTFNTSNGQAPFLSIFLYISEEPEYEKETVMIIEEILKQRIQGVKNEQGAWIPPAFPKLLYVMDENNIHEDSKYFYLTQLAAACVARRMVPDMISAKIMRKQYDGEVFPCMGCRSFLIPYKDPKTGKYKWYGRFNQGVVTLNLPDVGLSANGDLEKFWEILDERMELCKEALLIRHKRLLDTPLSTSPIHWKYGGLARLNGENFNELLYNGYSTISLGYAGLCECVYSLIGESNTSEKGKELALKIIKKMSDQCKAWYKQYNIGFSLYGTPLENTTYKFARCLKERFGIIPHVTDKDYITNSYHVHVTEEIDPFEKLAYEAPFQEYSSGGCISYIETGDMKHNEDAIITMMQYMYETIRYSELNGKFDNCHVCGFEGEIKLVEDEEKKEYVWECPNCGNRDHNKMNVVRRTCGYIGTNFWSKGRTDEIHDRYPHLDNHEMRC